MRKILIVLLSASFLAFPAVILAPKAVALVEDFAESVRVSTIQSLESLVNARISYESINPSIFSYLEIRGLELDHEFFRLKVQRLRIYYRIQDVLRGDLAAAPSDVRLDGIDLVIHPSSSGNTGRDISKMEERLQASAVLQAVFEAIDALPRQSSLSFRFLRINYDSPEIDMSFFLDQGEAQRDEGILGLRFNMAASLRQESGSFVSTAGSFRVRVSPGASEAELHASLGQFRSSLGTLRDINLQGTLDPERISLAKTFDSQAFDLRLEADTSFERVALEFLAEGWTPRQLLTLSLPGMDRMGADLVRTLLDGSYDGRISLSLGLDSLSGQMLPDLRFETDLSFQGVLPFFGSLGQFQVQASGKEGLVEIDSLHLREGSGLELGYTGSLAIDGLVPDGTLSFSSGDLIDFGQLSGKAEISGNGKLFQFRVLDFQAFDLPLLNPQLSLDADAAGLRYVLEAGFPASRVHEGEGRLSLSGSLGNPLELSGTDLLDSLVNRLELRALSASAAAALADRFLDIPAFLLGDEFAKARFDLVASLGFLDAAPLVSVPEFRLWGLASIEGEIEAKGRYQDSVLVLDSLLSPNLGFPGPGSRMEISGRAVLLDKSSLTLYLQSELPEGLLEVSGYYAADQLSLMSNLGLRASIGGIDAFTGGRAGLSIGLNVENFNSLGFEGLEPLEGLSVDLQGNFTSPELWEIAHFHLSSPLIQLPEPSISFGVPGLNLRGNPEEVSILPSQLEYGEQQYQLEGRLLIKDSDLAHPGLFLEIFTPGRAENADLSLELNQEGIRAELHSPNLDLSRVPAVGLGGRASLDLNFFLPLDSKEILEDAELGLELVLEEALFNKDPLRGRIQASLAAGVVELVPGTIQLAQTRLELLNGYLDLSTGQIDAKISLDEKLVIGLEGSMPLKAPKEAPMQGFDARLSLDMVPEVISPESRIELAIVGSGEELSFVGGPEGSLTGSFNVSTAYLSLESRAPMLMRASAFGTISQGQLNINVPRLAWVGADLSKVFDFDIFAIEAGNASGNARLVGDINDPSFFGTVLVEDLMAGFAYSPTTIGPGEAYLIFEDKNIYFPEFRIPAGGAQVQIEGNLGFNRWVPETYSFLFDVLGPLRISQDFRSVVTDGNAWGKVKVDGGLGNVQVEGEISVSQAAITLSSFDAGSGIPEEEGSSDAEVIVNLRVNADRGVVFFWPNQELPIFRSLVTPGGSVNLNLNTAEGSYVLRGDVPIRGGEIFYIDRNFYIRDGGVIFNENQDGFNPRVTLEADSRSTWQGQRVQLIIQVTENYLSDLQPRISSNPPLSQEALAVLVGGTLFPSGTDANYSLVGEAFLTSTDLASQFLILRDLESSIRNTLGLDLFSIRTGLFQNILRDIVLPDETASYQNLVGRYLQNTTVQMGKYLGDEVFVEFMLQLSENNPLNRGGLDPLGLSINPEFRVEWQTPFFLLEWNWQPSNAENLWVTDHRLTFSWGFN